MRYYAYTIILSQPSISLEYANIVVQIYIHLYNASDGTFSPRHQTMQAYRAPTLSHNQHLFQNG